MFLPVSGVPSGHSLELIFEHMDSDRVVLLCCFKAFIWRTSHLVTGVDIIDTTVNAIILVQNHCRF